MSFSRTVDVKLRNFNYIYLMRIIPNKRYLFKCKLVPSVLCDFCFMQEETNVHLFGNDVIYRICGLLTPNNVEIQLSYFNISFGVNYKKQAKKNSFYFHCTSCKILHLFLKT